MTTPNEPRALADLARALDDLIQLSEEAGQYDFTEPYPGTHYDADAQKCRDKAQCIRSTLLDSWQAPPSPDAGAAFSAAVDEVIEDAAYVEEVKYQGDVKQEEAARFLANSKAALLAFAPAGVRITTGEHDALDAVVAAARMIVDGDLSDDRVQRLRESLQALHDAWESRNGGAHE